MIDVNVARSTTTMDRIRAVLDWIRRALLDTPQSAASLIGPLVAPSWRFGARNREDKYRNDKIILTAQDIELNIARPAKNFGQKRKRESFDNKEEEGYRSYRDNTNNTKKPKRWRQTRETRSPPTTSSNQNNQPRVKERWSREYKAKRKQQERPSRYYLYSRSLH